MIRRASGPVAARVVYVRRRAGSPPAVRLRMRLTTAIEARLRGDSPAVVPLIDVVVLEAPRGAGK